MNYNMVWLQLLSDILTYSLTLCISKYVEIWTIILPILSQNEGSKARTERLRLGRRLARS